jgi:hypothetical protein
VDVHFRPPSDWFCFAISAMVSAGIRTNRYHTASSSWYFSWLAKIRWLLDKAYATLANRPITETPALKLEASCSWPETRLPEVAETGAIRRLFARSTRSIRLSACQPGTRNL